MQVLDKHEEEALRTSVVHYTEGQTRRRLLLYLQRTFINSFVLAIGDVLALIFASLAGGALRLFWKGDPMVPEWTALVILAWLIGATALRLLPSWGLGMVEELRRISLLLFAVFGLTSFALFMGKATIETSRFTVLMVFLFSLPILPLMRMLSKLLLIKWEVWGIPTAIYGKTDTGALVIQGLRREMGLGYFPIAIFDDDPAHLGDYVEGVPVIGSLAHSTPIAPVAILAMPEASRHNVLELLDGPLASYQHVVIIPDLHEAPSLWVKPRDLGGVLGLEVSSNLLVPLASISKRFIDLACVLLTAPFWVPVSACVGLAVWFHDRQNPFFAQERIGLNNSTFNTYKFRTMYTDAETLLEKRLQEDTKLREEWDANFKLKRDPRITSVGKFLRRTSLDELPQLWNVLRGDMSLVGPRPLPLYHYENLPLRVRRLRERVRPGLTGLWQISGRSEAGHLGMAKWDTYYVRNWSPWLDVVILVRTFRAVMKGQGAY